MAYIGASLDELEKTVSTINVVCDTMTGDGSTATLVLGASQEIPNTLTNVSVYFDGVMQRPTNDYTLNYKTVTFTTAPESGVKVTVLSYADEYLDVLSDKTVYGSGIADGAVTTAKTSSLSFGDSAISGSLDASKLTGALPAISGANVTGLAEGQPVIFSASDPTTTSNPTDGIGVMWINTTSGETYCCTDNANNDNVWKNIGDGTGHIELPSNPNNTGSFADMAESTSQNFTFSGATDYLGNNVTHYKVDTISNAALTVTTAEVAAGSAHAFSAGAVGADTTVTFRVRAKDSSGQYSTGVTVTMDITNLVYIAANGGVESTVGDYKIHAFTSTSSFNVTAVPASGNTTIEYLVVAGGGAGAAKAAGGGMGGGGGAGGLREGSATASVQSYTATVGAGQSGNNGSFWATTVPIGSPANAESSVHPTHQGVNSTFNGITSTGGGEGGMYASFPGTVGGSGGGGGGSWNINVAGGAGNTPSTSPSQGNNGGTGNSTFDAAGGGGAGGVGQNPPNSNNGGAGGVGKDLSAKFGTSLGDSGWFAGGGGGAHYPNTGAVAAGGQGGGAQGSYDTLNQNGDSGTGGGGGGVDGQGNASMIGGNGGSGIVLVRYKFQN